MHSIEVVESLFGTDRCVAIDFRGWGKSSKGSEDYDLETLGEDVISVVDQLGLKNFIIVGHSMGGKVAQMVARQPRGLKRLILVAPAPPIPLEVQEEQRQGMIASYEAREGVERGSASCRLVPSPTSIANRSSRTRCAEHRTRSGPGPNEE